MNKPVKNKEAERQRKQKEHEERMRTSTFTSQGRSFPSSSYGTLRVGPGGKIQAYGEYTFN